MMTQEELYWLEKRLRLKADDEERKIREKYDRWIKASKEEYQAHIPYQDRLNPPPLTLSLERDAKIEFVRLEILEPVLDDIDKARLEQLRKEKAEEQERRKQEEERNRKEAEERRRKEEEEREKKRENDLHQYEKEKQQKEKEKN